MSATPAALSRALTYPYPRPNFSYLFPTEPTPLPSSTQLTHLSTPTLTPILAIGSNAAPFQLRRKFPTPTTIPVLSITLHHHDIVFAAWLATYGSVPATLIHSPGTSIQAHLTLLNASQLRRMHETEAGYLLVRIPSSFVTLNSAPQTPPALQHHSFVYAYVAKFGPLFNDGNPMSMSAMPATNRTWKEYSQQEAQEIVRGIVEGEGIVQAGENLDTFVMNNVQDDDRRERIRAFIWDHCFREGGARFLQGKWTIIEELGDPKSVPTAI
eukprot:GFKZ01009705.1.p1 GENE.GFKZ01009705.1~~GFKZ01009705.1.p1  ORF type:complete len:269 (+),score=33.79 GFKZ01009705.1:278-1084(+)